MTERMTGQDLIVTSTESEALTQLHLAGTPYRIPLLDDVLELVAGGSRFSSR